MSHSHSSCDSLVQARAQRGRERRRSGLADVLASVAAADDITLVVGDPAVGIDMEDGSYGRLLGGGRFKPEKLFERGQLVAGAGSWVVTEGDPLQLTNVLGAPGSRLWRPSEEPLRG